MVVDDKALLPDLPLFTGENLPLADLDHGDSELGLGDARSSSCDGSSSSDESSSSGGYDRPPRHRARVEDTSGSSRRSAPVKLERSPA